MILISDFFILLTELIVVFLCQCY